MFPETCNYRKKNAGRSASWEQKQTIKKTKTNTKHTERHKLHMATEKTWNFFFKPTLTYLVVKQNKQTNPTNPKLIQIPLHQ